MKEIGSKNPTEGEIVQTKEVLVPKFGGLTISGRSGTGKTAAMELLASLYSIKPERIKKTGEIMRKITNAGKTSRGFMQRDEEIDEKIDNEQKEIINSADSNNPFMLEGRLAGLLAEQNQNVVKVLFVAPSEIRMRRILKRALEDKKQEIEKLEKERELALQSIAEPAVIEYLSQRLIDEKSEDVNLKIVNKREKEREKGDLERWRKKHPKLIGIDPFSPANKDKDGAHIYTIVVNTGKLTVEQVVNQLNEILIKRGLVETKTEEESFPKRAIIFQN